MIGNVSLFSGPEAETTCGVNPDYSCPSTGDTTRRIGKISKTHSLIVMPTSLAVEQMGKSIWHIPKFTSVGQNIPFFMIGILDGMIGFLNSMAMLFVPRIGGIILKRVSWLPAVILNGN